MVHFTISLWYIFFRVKFPILNTDGAHQYTKAIKLTITLQSKKISSKQGNIHFSLQEFGVRSSRAFLLIFLVVLITTSMECVICLDDGGVKFPCCSAGIDPNCLQLLVNTASNKPEGMRELLCPHCRRAIVAVEDEDGELKPGLVKGKGLCEELVVSTTNPDVYFDVDIGGFVVSRDEDFVEEANSVINQDSGDEALEEAVMLLNSVPQVFDDLDEPDDPAIYYDDNLGEMVVESVITFSTIPNVRVEMNNGRLVSATWLDDFSDGYSPM